MSDIAEAMPLGEPSRDYPMFKDDTWDQIRRVMAYGYLRTGKAIVSDNPPPTEALPPTAFIHFLQNHDQVGNRALGDRLHLGISRQLYRALTEILLLSPQIPMLFMGDEHLSLRPFHFFSDYDGKIAKAIRKNRTKEAENFGGIPSGRWAADIPDPNSISTFLSSKINWNQAACEGAMAWAEFIRRLLALRKESIIPLLEKAQGYAGSIIEAPDQCLFIDWKLGDKILQLRANLSDADATLTTGLGDVVYSAATVRDEFLRAHVVELYIK
jgi:1,4-alpha-glucan branching enzyme